MNNTDVDLFFEAFIEIDGYRVTNYVCNSFSCYKYVFLNV